MKEIRLNSLSLRDFQGGTITLNPNGSDIYIFGENGSGKTRIVSAFSWLLFNKDALGRADFELKNLDATGEAAHGLEHTVEAELSIGNKITTLKKVFKEKWTKKRGSPTREFSGHTTEYFVNGVPFQEKDFIANITLIAGDESRFRLLTSPTTFPALHWQKQRQLLLDICGDIKDEDVIASDPKLAPLMDLLGKTHTFDDHRKIIVARRGEINKELEKIPIRIDEVRRGLPDVTGLDRVACEEVVVELETALNSAKLRLQGVNTGGAVADLSRTLQAIHADIRKLEEGHRSGSLSSINRLNQQISEAQATSTANSRRLNVLDGEIKSKQFAMKELDNTLSRLRTQWTDLDEEAFQDTTTDTCPACNRPLPSDQVEAARAKALSVFRGDKAIRLGEINRKGKEAKDNRDRLAKDHEGLIDEFNTVNIKTPELANRVLALTSERDTLIVQSEFFAEVPGRGDLLRQASEIEAEIKAEREGRAQDIDKIKSEVATLQDKLNAALVSVHCFKTREQGEKRIEVLMDQEKVLSSEFERLEGKMFLMDLFIKTKCELLTDRINSKFEFTRFRLFNTLINQGVEPTCEIMVNGIGFNSGLNSAARTQAGMDIIRTLQKHYALSAPVFIDNRESCTSIPEMPGQVISLYVSPEDKTLRVEVQGGTK